MNMGTDFQNQVWTIVKSIPKGRVATYKEVARAAGRPQAFRAVGNALNKNSFLVKIPCHRVVKSDGGLGGYVRGQKAKMKLLEEENVLVDRKRMKILDFRDLFYKL